jgi:hypothetical protein
MSKKTNTEKIELHEVWDLGYTIAKFLTPRLKLFKEASAVIGAYPSSLSEKEWNEILDKLIWTFENYDALLYSSDSEQNIKLEEGLDLFRKYFKELWY